MIHFFRTAVAKVVAGVAAAAAAVAVAAVAVVAVVAQQQKINGSKMRVFEQEQISAGFETFRVAE